MAIVKLNGKDPVINRFADNVRDTVNPLIEQVNALEVPTVSSDPAATADMVGHSIIVKVPGQPATVKVCVPNSSGGYEWVGVALSS